MLGNLSDFNGPLDLIGVSFSHYNCQFQINLMSKEINPVELDFLLRFPSTPNVTTPVDFMNNWSWGGIKVSSWFVIPAFF